MHLWRTLIILGVFAAGSSPAAVIYKWTDANGIIHYADQPVPGAQKITTSSDTGPRVVAPPPMAAAARPPQAAGNQDGAAYTTFAIASPTPEQSFFSEPVPVQLTLDPALQANHALTWTLNGKPLDSFANQAQFALQNLPRGAFSLVAAIVDARTNETLKSASVTFYVHRPSILSPLHKRP